MCNYKILAQNENGYIVRCAGCKHFQITFGTTLCSLSEQDYQSWKLEIAEKYAMHEYVGFPLHKCIYLAVNNPTYCMVLNFNELEKLIALIEESDILIEVEDIIYNPLKTNGGAQNN